jgi:multiple sugar transport system substrate-binding protein
MVIGSPKKQRGVFVVRTQAVSRRQFLRGGILVAAGIGTSALAAACGSAAPPPTPETKVVTQVVEKQVTQVVEKQVTQVVEKQVVVTATPAPAAQAAPAATGPVTIRYYQFMNSVEDVPWWQGGIDRFQQKFPQITIAHEHAPWGNYWEKLTASVAAQTQADTILMVTMYVQQYGRLNAIQDLGPFALADKTSGLEDQWPIVKRANTINGKWPYQLHYDLSTFGVFYNKDMFKKAGVPDPNDKLPDYWTFDEFRDAAIKLTNPKGPSGKQWGLAGQFSLWTNAGPLLQSNGGGFINEENTKCILDKPESIAMMEQIAELFTKYHIAPTAEEARDIPLFESGRVAMEVVNPEVALRYRVRIKDFEWDLAPLPVSAKTKVKANWGHGGGLSMSSLTKQPDAAWKFLNYYMSADNLAEMVGKSARGIPGRPSIGKTLLRPDQPPKNMQLFLDAVAWGRCSTWSNFDELQKITGPADQLMQDGKRPVADVLKEITPKIDALLV